MRLKQAQFVRDVWNTVQDDEPDISTEQLFQRVADICHIGADEVADALFMTREKGEPQP
jgi:hypothetical protein